MLTSCCHLCCHSGELWGRGHLEVVKALLSKLAQLQAGLVQQQLRVWWQLQLPTLPAPTGVLLAWPQLGAVELQATAIA